MRLIETGTSLDAMSGMGALLGSKFFAFISHSLLTSYDLNAKKVKFSACV